jgi:hypothetical protein
MQPNVKHGTAAVLDLDPSLFRALLWRPFSPNRRIIDLGDERELDAQV